MDVCCLGCLNHFLVGNFPEVGSVAYVVCDGGVEQHGLLGHYPNLRAQPAEVEVTGVVAVHGKAAGDRIVEPLDERDHCALATAAGSHQSEGLAWLHREAQTLKHLDVGT